MGKAYSSTTVNIYKTMGDLSNMIMSHSGQMQFTEADGGLSVQIAFQAANRWNMYRFEKTFEPDEFVDKYRKNHPRTKIDTARRARIVADERNRIGRVLFHFIKNLFVAIDEGVVDLGEAFMPFMVIPTGHTGAGLTLYEALGRPMAEGRLASTDGLLGLPPPEGE